MSRTQLHWYAAALSENPEVEQTRRRSGREETQFPMYTVEMATLLEMTELKPFEDMLAMQALTAFSESLGHAMFVSHQWAGHHHPDPKHQQLRILQEAMKNVLSDFQSLLSWLLAVSVVLAQVTSRRSPSSVWYDYLCCPQDVSSVATQHRKGAIRSIPTYVARCEYFIILCPVVEHADGGMMLNLASWAGFHANYVLATCLASVEAGWASMWSLTAKVCQGLSFSSDALLDSMDLFLQSRGDVHALQWLSILLILAHVELVTGELLNYCGEAGELLFA